MSAISQVSPANTLDRSDPGDETQRNFRYQHAYGVILLVAAATGNKPYVYIWCEHHEDFLAERHDGLFDAYQIKTATPENGAWSLTRDALRNSIKKFIILDLKFPNKIHGFYFVSNVACLDTTDDKKMHLSPRVLLREVQRVTDDSQLPHYAKTSFNALKKHCSCSAPDLMKVLKRLWLIVGPERNSFEAEISHNHLPGLAECQSCTPAELNGLRDELIHKIFDSSSLKTDDPSRHWCCINGDDTHDPFLKAKRILVEDVVAFIREKQPVPFRFLPESSLNLGGASTALPVLEAKMIQGDLFDQVQTMRRRALAAENRLMGLAHIEPENFDQILDQIVGVVQGECDEAFLSASHGHEPFGRRMLDDVYKRLRKAAAERSHMVHRQEYECLVGVAGLLTGECTIWWSQRFQLEVAS